MVTTSLVAVALDGSVDLDQAADRIAWPVERRYPYGLALRCPDGQLAYVFTFGAVVWLGRDRADPSLQAAIEAATGRESLPDTADTWAVEVEEGVSGPRIRVGWDRIRLPAPSADLLAATALLLGQSAALERYEARAERLVEEARALSHELVRTGRPPSTTRALVRQVGRVNRDRLAMTSTMYILDRPEETWVDAEVAALHDELMAGLELPLRHESLLRKLQAVESATRLVIELWHGRTANLLEWAIVVLIVVEIAITLVEHAVG